MTNSDGPAVGMTRRQNLCGIASTGLAATGLAAVGLPLLGATPVAAATEAGTVSALRGMAVAEAGPQTRPLSEAAPVFLDDVLRTGDDSRLGLILGKATSVRLGSRAKVRIDRYLVNAGTDLVLDNGPMLIDKQDPPGRNLLTVKSPYALIAVRGTRFFAGVLDDGFGVFVERGRVDVRAAGARVSVGPGEGTTIATVGQRPGEVKRWGAPKIARAMALVN